MTETDICNLALINIGAKTIVSLTESSPEAQACLRLYSVARDVLLQMHNWSFATKYEALALVTRANVYRFEYAYQYPADCLKAQGIFRTLPTADPIVFKRVGTQIWTDEENAVLVYTKKATATSEFVPYFITALTHFLAARLVPSLIKSDKLQQIMTRAQITYTYQAIHLDALEGFDNVMPSSADIFNNARN